MKKTRQAFGPAPQFVRRGRTVSAPRSPILEFGWGGQIVC